MGITIGIHTCLKKPEIKINQLMGTIYRLQKVTSNIRNVEFILTIGDTSKEQLHCINELNNYQGENLLEKIDNIYEYTNSIGHGYNYVLKNAKYDIILQTDDDFYFGMDYFEHNETKITENCLFTNNEYVKYNADYFEYLYESFNNFEEKDTSLFYFNWSWSNTHFLDIKYDKEIFRKMKLIFPISRTSLLDESTYKQWKISGYYYSNFVHMITKKFHEKIGYFIENSNCPCTELEMDKRIAYNHRYVNLLSGIEFFTQHVNWMGTLVQK